MMLLGLLFSSFVFSQNVVDVQEIKKIYSPSIKNNVLVVKGRIGSHIYDYLSYEEKSVRQVKYISLNSFGGDHDWALKIAQKIKDFGLNTYLKTGHVCASACVYLFTAGNKRTMDVDAWLGVHGARLGASYLVQFYQKCPPKTKVLTDKQSIDDTQFSQECKDYLNFWYLTSLEATQKAFEFLESQGVSSRLSEMYFSFADTPDWYNDLNVLKKPDWVITSDVALMLGFATEIKHQP